MTSTFTIAIHHPKHNNLTETFRFDIPSHVNETSFADHVQVLFNQPFNAPEGDPTAWWDETQRRIQSIAEEYNADVEQITDPLIIKVAY